MRLDSHAVRGALASLALGLAGAMLHASLGATSAPSDAIRFGAKVAMGAALAWLALWIAWRVGRGASRPTRRRVTRWAPVAALALTSVVLIALFWKSSSRLTLNLVGFLAIALPVTWVVARRAGARSAAVAVLAVGVLGAGTRGVNLTRAPVIADTLPESVVKWDAGWPTVGWRLRHELVLEQPLPPGPQRLVFPFARRYEGAARVFATVNGRDVGQVGPEPNGVFVPIPEEMRGERRFTFELRADRTDPSLRIMAFRYGRGATLPGVASGYFDGLAWRTGTYNDAAGRHQDGVYVVRVVGI